LLGGLNIYCGRILAYVWLRYVEVKGLIGRKTMVGNQLQEREEIAYLIKWETWVAWNGEVVVESYVLDFFLCFPVWLGVSDCSSSNSDIWDGEEGRLVSRGKAPLLFLFNKTDAMRLLE
jgi:hypothetical protein